MVAGWHALSLKIPVPAHAGWCDWCACSYDPVIRKYAPHIIDPGDRTGAEEVLFHKADRIPYGAFALWTCFVADPESEILFRTEIIEDSGLDDFPIGLLSHEDSILIDSNH